MSDHRIRSMVNSEQEAVRRRARSEGEQTTEHSQPDVFLSSLSGAVAPDWGRVSSALANAGDGVRGQIVGQLQRHGNTAVQRVLQGGQADKQAEDEEGLADRIQRASGGRDLEGGVQRRLEEGLGANISDVRIHTDGEADNLARSVDAVAFTSGRDIFFRSGTFNPTTPEGFQLLAHEAAHTVQQASGPVAGAPAAGGVSLSDPSDAYEQAASQAAARVASGAAASVGAAAAAPPTVQREVAPEEEDLQKKKPEEEEQPA